MWDVEIRFADLELPITANSGSVIISATYLCSAIKTILPRFNVTAGTIDDLFGRLTPTQKHASRLQFSVLHLDTAVDQSHPAPDPRVAVFVTARMLQAGVGNARSIFPSATFRGSIYLANGGTYPAVLVHHMLSLTLSHLPLGRSPHHPHGGVEACRMRRNHAMEKRQLNPVERIFRRAGHALIQRIAHDPEVVYCLEWRDLERVMAQVYEEIGFQVTLTKASQDGGKDLVLFCVSGQASRGSKPCKYYVELKHWKPGNKVGSTPVQKLVEVAVRDAVSGAVMLSTSGFATCHAGEGGTSPALHLGDLSTIHTLCRCYLASRAERVFTTKTLEEILTIDWKDEDTA
jgi:hypothetical protein